MGNGWVIIGQPRVGWDIGLVELVGSDINNLLKARVKMKLTIIVTGEPNGMSALPVFQQKSVAHKSHNLYFEV